MLDLLTAIFSAQGVQLVIGGAMGGVARWFFLRVKIWDGLSAVVLGAILGYYASPILEPMMAGALSGFATDPAKLPAFAAFATGVLGIALVGFAIDWFQAKAKQLTKEGSVDPIPKPSGDGS